MRELDNSSKPNQTRAKGSPPEKLLSASKSYLLFLRVTLKKGVANDNDSNDE
jgi:hypothetical protein